MKDAAKCDKRCEWQNSANQKNAERILHPQFTSEGMSSSGRLKFNAIYLIVVHLGGYQVSMRVCAPATRSFCSQGGVPLAY